MMSWWNLKLIAEQRDDKNPNLQSIFSLGHQCCWPSQFIYFTFATHMSNRPRKEKTKKSQTLLKIVSSSSQKVQLSHIQRLTASQLYKFGIFSRYTWGIVLVQSDYWQFNAIYNPLIHWFDRYLLFQVFIVCNN